MQRNQRGGQRVHPLHPEGPQPAGSALALPGRGAGDPHPGCHHRGVREAQAAGRGARR